MKESWEDSDKENEDVSHVTIMCNNNFIGERLLG